uniref:Uncharacterized protein n=1 Tax=Ovis aries TaxID=9940 RepID=A0AC11ESZ2_SHEEP
MAAQIPESDQIKQFKEFLGTYNKLTETCFLDCVKDFTTREVKPEEIDTEPLFEFPEPHSKFPLAVCSTYGNVSFHVTLSIHLTLSSPLPMSISLFAMSVSPLLSFK